MLAKHKSALPPASPASQEAKQLKAEPPRLRSTDSMPPCSLLLLCCLHSTLAITFITPLQQQICATPQGKTVVTLTLPQPQAPPPNQVSTRPGSLHNEAVC